ncbi:MAG: acetyl-CoA carboxylase biotin carboxylase subunit [Deltaproteobacteria bacterium]|nr:acetyl-CoA carboxylase biotin carboxylase subunit [Deltaproteobacteria bacterium]
MIRKVLIANRGEIAVRIIRTCRELGLGTVAVYSDVDARALHVLEADEAVHLGAAAPAESYLNVAKLMDACRATGADALHPGYGFLSERPLIAEACSENGVTFIGPPPHAMQLLGSKTESRKLMMEHGVPVTPGTPAEDWTVPRLAAAAGKLGYPVLLKAAAGGGGKGMRVVFGPETIEADHAAAVREATSAFGDGTVYLEKMVMSPRHVEVQILADQHGRCIHLGERECSIQRRHQKIIEESPSVVVDEDLRNRMGEVAVRAAQAAGYTNAGTVEFLVDADRNFYFLEINARLQVEHPVTEAVTGIDLVKKQIEVAAGEPLGLTQSDVVRRGHAIEVRIYAEDPAHDFRPSPGKILAYEEPQGPGIRVDSGVYAGYTVPFEYDPILAKLIAFGDDRETARRRLVKALDRFTVLGIATPTAYLRDILNHPAFVAGELATDFLTKHFAAWKQPTAHELEAVVAAALAARSRPARAAATGSAAADPNVLGPDSPWNRLGAWTLNS